MHDQSEKGAIPDKFDTVAVTVNSLKSIDLVMSDMSSPVPTSSEEINPERVSKIDSMDTVCSPSTVLKARLTFAMQLWNSSPLTSMSPALAGGPVPSAKSQTKSSVYRRGLVPCIKESHIASPKERWLSTWTQSTSVSF